MEDSPTSNSHPDSSECQMITEIEAENLIGKVQENLLVTEKVLDTNVKGATDIHGTKMLFPMEPLKIIGGMVSGKSKNLDFQNLQAKECYTVIQEAFRKRKKTEDTITMAEECRAKKMSMMPSKAETSKMYLILPSHAERHKDAIYKIISNKKVKLCNNSFYKNISSNVEFQVAFTNSKNVKKLIVRAKI